MGVDGGIAGSSSQVFPLPVGNMLAVSLNVALGQSEVDQEYFMGGFIESHTKIFRFDVPVNEVPVVDVLYPADHLIDEHEHCLEGKLAEGVLE